MACKISRSIIKVQLVYDKPFLKLCCTDMEFMMDKKFDFSELSQFIDFQ